MPSLMVLVTLAAGFAILTPLAYKNLGETAMAQALVVSNMFATRDMGTVLVPCLLLWTHIYTLGLLSEGRSYAVRFEIVRLLIVLPLGAAIFFGASSIEPLAWVAAYVGLSICGVLAVYRSDKNTIMIINQ